MPSASIVLRDDVATIESDENQALAVTGGLSGTITNGGGASTWLNTAGGNVATTNAQAQSMIELPPGASIPLPPPCRAFSHKTLAGQNTVLFWVPRRD